MNTHLLVLACVTAIVLLLFRRDRPSPTSVEPSVIDAFRKKKRQQWLLAIPVGLVAILIFWQREHPFGHGNVFLSVVALAIVVWACLFTYRNWRCPKCGAYLGKQAWKAGVCPKCGTALREPRRKGP